MAIALVHNANNSSGGSGGPITATINSISTGNMIVVGVGWTGDASVVSPVSITVSSVTDTNGNLYNPVPGTLTSSSQHWRNQIWVAANISNNTNVNNTITVNFSDNVNVWYPAIGTSEWSGAATVSPADTVGNTAQGTGGTLAISTNGATTNVNELIYSMIVQIASPAPTAVQTSIQSNSGLNDEYQIATNTNTYTNSWTGGTGAWYAAIAAFTPPTQFDMNSRGVCVSG